MISCNRWDRFSRNLYYSMTVINELHKPGVTVNTVEQPLDISSSDNKILLSLYLTMPEVENDKIANLYIKTLEKLFEKDDYNRRDEIQKSKKELEKLELRKSNLQNDLMDRIITSHDYQEMKSRVEKEIGLFKDKLTDLQQQTSPFKIYIQKEVPMLENLMEYYRKSNGATKKKILGCIFAEKLVLENGRVATSTFTETIQFIINASEVLVPRMKISCNICSLTDTFQRLMITILEDPIS
ncbi:MAG TPA: recombinase family protein [Bacteroidales bacterium]|nr:recombinase family protein [Bacteroidales bacterium]